jgi:hypothetical protein
VLKHGASRSVDIGEIEMQRKEKTPCPKTMKLAQKVSANG